MDAQAQDRCHRIGQTREVHIYRLVTEHTVEENILKKSLQKRNLEELAITQGSFTTDFFKKLDLHDFFKGESGTVASHDWLHDTGQGKEEGEEEEVADDGNDTIQASDQLAAELMPKNELTADGEEWETALANVEEETDVQAMQRAKREEKKQLEEFDESIPLQEEDSSAPTQVVMDESGEAVADLPAVSDFPQVSDLTGIQKYALAFLDDVSPVLDSEDEVKGEVTGEEGVDETEWHLEELQRMKEEEERMEEDEEVLFYEVTGSSADAYYQQVQILQQHGIMGEVELYAPPNPEMVDRHLFLYDGHAAPEPSYERRRRKKEKKRRKELRHQQRQHEGVSVGPVKRPPDPISTGERHSTRPVKRTRVYDDDYVEGEEEDSPVKNVIKISKEQLKEALGGMKTKSSRRGERERLRESGGWATSKQRQPWVFGEVSHGPQWTAEEDEALAAAAHALGGNWELLADIVSSASSAGRFRRSPRQCLDRWTNYIKPREDGQDVPEPGSGGVPHTAQHQHHIVVGGLIRSLQCRRPPGRSGLPVIRKGTIDLSTAEHIPQHPSQVQVQDLVLQASGLSEFSNLTADRVERLHDEGLILVKDAQDQHIKMVKREGNKGPPPVSIMPFPPQFTTKLAPSSTMNANYPFMTPKQPTHMDPQGAMGRGGHFDPRIASQLMRGQVQRYPPTSSQHSVVLAGSNAGVTQQATLAHINRAVAQGPTSVAPTTTSQQPTSSSHAGMMAAAAAVAGGATTVRLPPNLTQQQIQQIHLIQQHQQQQRLMQARGAASSGQVPPAALASTSTPTPTLTPPPTLSAASVLTSTPVSKQIGKKGQRARSKEKAAEGADPSQSSQLLLRSASALDPTQRPTAGQPPVQNALLFLIKRVPGLKAQIQEVTSRKDSTDQEKVEMISKLVQQHSSQLRNPQVHTRRQPQQQGAPAAIPTSTFSTPGVSTPAAMASQPAQGEARLLSTLRSAHPRRPPQSK
eukprot:TRINITY_DN7920_c2_g3_i4.p1 TRINITY_DN7920_c2_g3~~TRINITY_DN7920_c2_g3_i4.p1  ORF type:complete len:1126 (+),score=261.13 TRINITY_DN7920_c2_g3_i4:449-3379(+)